MLDMSIEQIENKYWRNVPINSSDLIKSIYAIRKKKIRELSVEDLRVMIGQNESLNILIPIAIDILSSNIFAEGDYYEGDLLKSVLTIEKSFWVQNPKIKKHLISLFANNKEALKEIKGPLLEAYQDFLD